MTKKKSAFTRKAKAIEPEVMEEISLGDIVEDLRTNFKDDKFFTLDNEADLSMLEVKHWVKASGPMAEVTGAPGYPAGLVTIFQGVSDSGKTTAAIHALVETQRAGGIGVVILTEPKFSVERALLMGVRRNALIIIKVKTVEEAEEKAAETIKRIRIKYAEKPITFVWDSIGFAKCQMEVENKKKNNMWKASAVKTMLGTMQMWLDEDNITFIGINHTYMTMQGRKKGGGGEGVKLAGAMIFDFSSIGKIKIDGYIASKDFDYKDHDGNDISFQEGEEVPKPIVLGVTGDKDKKGMPKIFKAENIEKVEGKVVGSKTIIKNVKNHVGTPFLEVEGMIDKYGFIYDRSPDTKPKV